MAGRRLSQGLSPLSYMGVRPVTPPQLILQERAPTANDVIGYPLGTQWVYTHPSIPTSSKQYVLVNSEQNVAVWIPLGSAAGGSISVINILPVVNTPGAGVYTPSAGMLFCQIELVGGGAGGGGINGVIDLIAGSGGGSGGYCKKLFDAATIGAGQNFFVGSGGSGGIAGTPGNNGTSSTFGTVVVLTAHGGVGGIGTGPNQRYNQGGSGGIATGGDINVKGGQGGAGAQAYGGGGAFAAYSGSGGSNIYGTGGNSDTINIIGGINGNDGTGYGSGGSGGLAFNSTGDGGAGADGAIIITEYLS